MRMSYGFFKKKDTIANLIHSNYLDINLISLIVIFIIYGFEVMENWYEFRIIIIKYYLKRKRLFKILLKINF